MGALLAAPGGRPGGFPIAALMRPPDPETGEDETIWLERARTAAAHGPLGHHTHWTSPTHARPRLDGGGDAGERVRREGEWLREQGLRPTLFCGGGWYMDESVARAVAELGYADCTATSFRPPYLDDGAPRLALDAPGRLALPDGGELLELPTTHSLGMAARAAVERSRALASRSFTSTSTTPTCSTAAARSRSAWRSRCSAAAGPPSIWTSSPS